MKTIKATILLVPILLVITLDHAILELLSSDEDKISQMHGIISKILMPISLGVSILFINKMNNFLKLWFALALLFFGFLIMESLYSYRNFFIYPHVFSKITTIFISFYTLVYCAKIEFVSTKLLMNIILILITLNLIVVNRDALSFSSFVDHERGIYASSVYLLMLPCVYYLNLFIFTDKVIYFFIFLITLGLIFFLQHRTVWVSLGFTLVLNIIILIKNNKLKLSVLFKGFSYILTILLLVIFGIFTQDKLKDKVVKNVEDILNPTEKGTGNWRWEQFTSYTPYIEKNLISGMRFDGFELPIKFYNPDTGLTDFDDKTGHHFHSFYVDKVFYLGLLGIILYTTLNFYIINRFLRNQRITPANITFLVYSISGLIYGISYDWPSWNYCIVGLALWVVMNDEGSEQPKKVEVENDDYTMDAQLVSENKI